MLSRSFPRSGLAVIVFPLLLLAGCGGESSGPDLGDWTLKTNELALQKDLQVSESEAFYFGRIFDLDVTSDGRMVVADWDAKNIKVLRPDGTLIDTLGREGSGPGEFQQLRSVQAARGDSIYAYDARRSRLTVFAPAPSLQLDRTVTIPRKQAAATNVLALSGCLIGKFTTFSAPEEGVSRPDPNAWRWISESGTPGDTLLLAPQSKMALKSLDEGGGRIRYLPMTGETVTALDPAGRLYHGWTDSLRISAHDLNGSSEVVASVPTEPLPMQAADRDSMLSDISGTMKDMVASALPDTKPAFTQLLVDDKERLWVERPTKATVPKHRWWILNPTSKTIHEVQVPSEVDLEVVQNGMAYGTTETEMGAPAVVRYRIDSSS